MIRKDTLYRQEGAAMRRFGRPLRAPWRRESRSYAREGQSYLRGEEGAELISFALAVPVLFGFVFGVMQICLAFYTHEYISELAREGTRYGMVHGAYCMNSGGGSCTASTTSSNSTSVYSYVEGLGLPNLGGGAMTPVVTYPDGDEVPPHHVQVTVTYAFPYRIPWVTNKTLTMSSTSEMAIIQ